MYNAGNVTIGTCNNGCGVNNVTLPQTPDTCSQQQGCLSLGANDCFACQAQWPWLVGG